MCCLGSEDVLPRLCWCVDSEDVFVALYVLPRFCITFGLKLWVQLISTVQCMTFESQSRWLCREIIEFRRPRVIGCGVPWLLDSWLFWQFTSGGEMSRDVIYCLEFILVTLNYPTNVLLQSVVRQTCWLTSYYRNLYVLGKKNKLCIQQLQEI